MKYMWIGALFLFLAYGAAQRMGALGALPGAAPRVAPAGGTATAGTAGVGPAPATAQELIGALRAAGPAQERRNECRDLCEQRGIAGQLDEPGVQSCRLRCGAAVPGAAGPGAAGATPSAQATDRPQIRRITRAPADHRPQAVSEWR